MTYELKRGDLRPFFVAVLKDDFGEATESVVDLSTATGVVFNMMGPSPGTAVKINRGAGTISNGTAGEVTYMWGSADVNTAGSYKMECEVMWGDGKPETWPSGPSGGNFWDVLISQDIA